MASNNGFAKGRPDRVDCKTAPPVNIFRPNLQLGEYAIIVIIIIIIRSFSCIDWFNVV